jgi:hypothetical protein
VAVRLIALGATGLLLACGADGRLGAPNRSQFLDLPVTSWIGQEPVTVDTVDRPEVRLELSAVEFRVSSGSQVWPASELQDAPLGPTATTVRARPGTTAEP